MRAPRTPARHRAGQKRLRDDRGALAAALLALLAPGCGPVVTIPGERDAAPSDAGWRDGAGPGDATPPDGAISPDGAPDPDAAPPVDPCAPIPGVSYSSLVTVGPVTDRPPASHADLNIKLRGWEVTGGTLGLVTIPGPTDPLAPKLYGLFGPDRVPTFSTNYAVYNWDWGTNSRGTLITETEVTLSGFATAAGEILELPTSGYDIGLGHQARVLYVDDDSITLKYTGEDNVVMGYTLHVVGLCVEPSLRARYLADDAAGRSQLPAIDANQPFGRARGAEIQVSIRDTGAFMDPRCEKDWW